MERNPANRLIWQISHYLHGFIHPRWLFGISPINRNCFFNINLHHTCNLKEYIPTSRQCFSNMFLLFWNMLLFVFSILVFSKYFQLPLMKRNHVRNLGWHVSVKFHSSTHECILGEGFQFCPANHGAVFFLLGIYFDGNQQKLLPNCGM